MKWSPICLFVLLSIILGGCTEAQQTSIQQNEVYPNSSVLAETTSPAFINIQNAEHTSRSENGAYYLSGTVSDNCSEIWVEAENIGSGLYDNYQLSEFKHGDVNFRYGIREDWGNLFDGETSYTFTAHCDGEQEVKDIIQFSYSAPLPSYTLPVPINSYTKPTYSFPSDSSTSYNHSDSTVEQLKNSGAYLRSTCDDTYVFLGTFGGRYDSDSIFYRYGDYGSKYSDKSIWYKYGDYGGAYSNCSAFYKYASEPPTIMIGEEIVGYLSQYKYAGSNTLDPNEVLIYAYKEFDDDYYLDLVRN